MFQHIYIAACQSSTCTTSAPYRQIHGVNHSFIHSFIFTAQSLLNVLRQPTPAQVTQHPHMYTLVWQQRMALAETSARLWQDVIMFGAHTVSVEAPVGVLAPVKEVEPGHWPRGACL